MLVGRQVYILLDAIQINLANYVGCCARRSETRGVALVYVYADLAAVEYVNRFGQDHWKRLNGERIQQPFGFYSYQTLPQMGALYLSGNCYFEREGRLAHN